MVRLYVTLTSQIISYVAEFLIPTFAKAADKGFFQELVDGKVKLTTFLDSIDTNSPTMIVQSDGTVAEAFLSDRIKGPADGFDER